MNAHDVRRLRVCDVCDTLHDRDDMLTKFGDLCQVCALRRSGGITGFMAMYPVDDWKRLQLGVVGVKGMQTLLTAIRKATAP